VSADRDRSPLVAGVELGGTKAVAVLAHGDRIVERSRVPTTDPGSTLAALSAQLDRWQQAGHTFRAIGIGSFGPVGLDPRRADYGYVTTTPKPGWGNTDVRGHFAERFDVPIGFDNDVNGAVLAENLWGAAHGCDVAVYLTIGTGIGGGVVVSGRLVHGLVHPEHGHFRVRRRRADDTFPGVCPYHGDCIEGLASGPAIAARAGRRAPELPPEHPVWIDVAGELGEFMALLVLAISPQRILVGGGVGYGQRWLLPRIREATLATLGGYVAALEETAIETLIVPPGLGDDAGPLGAVALGLAALGGAEIPTTDG
jgi:fructokinase